MLGVMSSTPVPEMIDSDSLERMAQSAVNQWADADATGQFNMEVDCADLAKVTQELRIFRALQRGEPVPQMLLAEPPED